MRFYDDEYYVCPNCGFVEGTEQKELGMLSCGTILKQKYIVGKSIGRGGFGITYIGYNTVLDQKVAIKEYFPKGYAERSYRDKLTMLYTGSGDSYEKGKLRFLNEAKTLAQFNSMQGIVSIYDFFEENNTAYIVMEYLEGENLDQYVKKNGTADVQLTTKMAKSICNTLSVIHAQNVIHRDISPDNIFMCTDGSFKLIDFGAVKQCFNNGHSSSSIIMKHGYAPIEQYSSKTKLGATTDIYSLAATMYFLLTGKIPDNSIDRTNTDELVSPRSFNGSIPEYLSIAIMKALSLNAEDRFQSADEFLKALNGEEERKNRYKWLKYFSFGLAFFFIVFVLILLFKRSLSNEQSVGTSNKATSDKVTVYSDISIVYQPEDKSVYVKENAFFRVEAEGEDLTFKWQTSKDNGETWEDSYLNYADTNMLLVVGEMHRNGYMFRCVIKNGDGTEVISEPAMLNVIERDALKIVTQPVDQVAPVDKELHFSVEVNGTDVTYKWQTSKDDGVTWVDSELSGSKTQEITIVAKKFRDGYMFRCVATDKWGTQIISDAAKLTIEELNE